MGKPTIDDEWWALTESLLRPAKPRRFKYPGHKPVPDRTASTGILFVLRTAFAGALPAEMGCGVWRRLFMCKCRDATRQSPSHPVAIGHSQGKGR